MKNKLLYFSIVLYIIIILQTTLLDYIRIYNVKPNLVLVFIVCIALIRGGLEGPFFGLGAGLLLDIISGQLIGPHALLGFLVGFALCGFNQRFYKDNVFACALITIIVTFLYETIMLIPAVHLGDFKLILDIVRSDIAVETAYNVVMSVPLYIIMLKINEKIDVSEKSTNKY